MSKAQARDRGGGDKSKHSSRLGTARCLPCESSPTHPNQAEADVVQRAHQLAARRRVRGAAVRPERGGPGGLNPQRCRSASDLSVRAVCIMFTRHAEQ